MNVSYECHFFSPRNNINYPHALVIRRIGKDIKRQHVTRRRSYGKQQDRFKKQKGETIYQAKAGKRPRRYESDPYGGMPPPPVFTDRQRTVRCRSRHASKFKLNFIF